MTILNNTKLKRKSLYTPDFFQGSALYITCNDINESIAFIRFIQSDACVVSAAKHTHL